MYCAAKIKLSMDTWGIQTKADNRMQEGLGFILIGGGRLPVGIIAFDHLADVLAGYQMNSIIEVKGRFKANVIYHNGKLKHGYQIVADSISE